MPTAVWTVVKQWHHATPLAGMTRIAISERQDGRTVTWLEQLAGEDDASTRLIHECAV